MQQRSGRADRRAHTQCVADGVTQFGTVQRVKMEILHAFTAEDFEEGARSAAEVEKEKEERIYSEKMRRALERQADDVRFVRNLGLRV